MGLESRRDIVPVRKIKEDFREELPFVMGFEGWVNVQDTDGRSGGTSRSRALGKHMVYRERTLWITQCKLCIGNKGRKGRLEPEVYF